jgi:hypothetical protein
LNPVPAVVAGRVVEGIAGFQLPEVEEAQHAEPIVHGNDDDVGGAGEVCASYIGSAV